MPLRPLSYGEIVRKLQAAGFTEAGGGKHAKFVKTTEEGTRTTIVPRHRVIKTGTIRSIIRLAGITAEEWETL